jgi:hypothetical protein
MRQVREVRIMETRLNRSQVTNFNSLNPLFKSLARVSLGRYSLKPGNSERKGWLRSRI